MSRHALVALLAAIALSACSKAPPEAPAPTPTPAPAVAETPAAPPAEPAGDAKAGSTLSVTSVDLGTDLGDDGRIVTAKESFTPSDTIIVVITTDNVGAPPVKAQVTARWLDPEGVVFNEESREQEFRGLEFVNFRVAEPKGFKHGAYKLEVAVNGSTVQMREFSIN